MSCSALPLDGRKARVASLSTAKRRDPRRRMSPRAGEDELGDDRSARNKGQRKRSPLDVVVGCGDCRRRGLASQELHRRLMRPAVLLDVPLGSLVKATTGVVLSHLGFLIGGTPRVAPVGNEMTGQTDRERLCGASSL